MMASVTDDGGRTPARRWLRQRSRWLEGCYQTWLVHLRSPYRLWRDLGTRRFIGLQLTLALPVLTTLVTPLLWALILVYLVERPRAQRRAVPGAGAGPGVAAGALGSLLTVYALMIGCMEHGLLRAVRTMLLAPVYWALMSVAAYRALFHLLIRRARPGARRPAGARERAERPPGQRRQRDPVMSTAVLGPRRELSRSGQPAKRADLATTGVIAAACVLSVAAYLHFYPHGETIAYGDAKSHLLIARRVLFADTPGVGQLGGVWLPLPHILMLPLIWNNWAYYSGFAGSVVMMLAYVACRVLVYKFVWHLTRQRWAALCGTAVFALNPNVLYMQSTPMTELLMFATMMGRSTGCCAGSRRTTTTSSITCTCSSPASPRCCAP